MNLTQRLKPYQVAHQLIHRLEPYQVNAVPSMFRAFTWPQLRFWAMLLDGDDEGIIRLAGADPDESVPDPDEWFGRVKV